MSDEVKQGTAPAAEKAEAAPAAAGGEKASPVKSLPKKEKPDKCEQCGKSLSRVKWYYRDGGYYCTRRCWKEFKAKREEEMRSAQAQAQPTA